MVDLTARPAPTRFGEHVARCGVHVMESVNIPLFRISHGRCGGMVFGAPVVLLTTTGRTTGRRFTKPLLALPDGPAWIVVGSRGGTEGHPQWYLNLLAYRDAPARLAPPVLEAKGEQPVAVDVEVLDAAGRATWWPRLAAVYPRFDAYQAGAPHARDPGRPAQSAPLTIASTAARSAMPAGAAVSTCRARSTTAASPAAPGQAATSRSARAASSTEPDDTRDRRRLDELRGDLRPRTSRPRRR